MPLLGVLTIVMQVFFAVHVVNTGRDRFWIYIIVFIPLIGCLVYFITQILPELGQNKMIRKTGNSLIKAIDPQRELRKRKEEIEISDSIENRLSLGDECLEAGLLEDGLALYESCLKGIHGDDPHIMLKIARTCFQLKYFEKCRQMLEALIEKNPDFHSHEGHLLYARVLESLGLLEKAFKEYELLATSYPGEEARVRYGLLLKKEGKSVHAIEMFKETLLRAKRAPNYYRKKEKKWVKISQDNVSRNA